MSPVPPVIFQRVSPGHYWSKDRRFDVWEIGDGEHVGYDCDHPAKEYGRLHEVFDWCASRAMWLPGVAA